MSTNTCKSNLAHGVTDPCFLHIDDFCKQAIKEASLFHFGLVVDWFTQSRLSHENRLWTSFIFAAKTLVPSPIMPNFLTMVVQQLFFFRNRFAILSFLKVECLNRQFVICRSERDIYWRDSSHCIIRIQSVLHPSYI